MDRTPILHPLQVERYLQEKGLEGALGGFISRQRVGIQFSTIDRFLLCHGYILELGRTPGSFGSHDLVRAVPVPRRTSGPRLVVADRQDHVMYIAHKQARG